METLSSRDFFGTRVELKVREFGNSLGVVLPREVIRRLRTKDGEPLFLIEAGEYRGEISV